MKTTNVMIVGVGGQGTLLTSRIIGNVALKMGLDVKMSEVHGMAQRGGSVVTYVRFGEKIAQPVVDEGEVDVLISFERLEAQRYAHFLKKDGVMIVNDCQIDPMTVVIGAKEYPLGIIENLQRSHDIRVIDGMAEALALGNSKVVNVVVLGLAAKVIGFKEEDWLDTIKATVPQKTIDINVAAFKAGYEK